MEWFHLNFIWIFIYLYVAIPAEEAEQNDNIAIVITSHGGHIGFMEGLFPRHQGYMDRLFSQYVKAVFTHGPQHLKQDWPVTDHGTIIRGIDWPN